MVENFFFSFFFYDVAAGYHRKKMKNKIKMPTGMCIQLFKMPSPWGKGKKSFT